MSKFTKDAPFEFEGVQMWRDQHTLAVTFNAGMFERLLPNDHPAYHAFIEAERDGWQWTNDDHTEARKGRWTVGLNEATWSTQKWVLSHDDFGCALVTDGNRDEANDSQWNVVVRAAEEMSDFLAWKAAQDQPAEPTVFGYVGTITEGNGSVWDVTRNADEKDYFTWTERETGTQGISNWNNLPWRETFEAVTR